MERELLKGHLDMLLLATIARQPGHGYGIALNLADRSAGAFNLAEGTLYPALHRLEAHGLVVSNWQKVDGRRRRLYHITADGQRQLADQTATWDAMQHAIRAVLSIAPQT